MEEKAAAKAPMVTASRAGRDRQGGKAGPVGARHRRQDEPDEARDLQ